MERVMIELSLDGGEKGWKVDLGGSQRAIKATPRKDKIGKICWLKDKGVVFKMNEVRQSSYSGSVVSLKDIQGFFQKSTLFEFIVEEVLLAVWGMAPDKVAGYLRDLESLPSGSGNIAATESLLWRPPVDPWEDVPCLLTTEALACMRALGFARDLGFRCVELKGDSESGVLARFESILAVFDVASTVSVDQWQGSLRQESGVKPSTEKLQFTPISMSYKELNYGALNRELHCLQKVNNIGYSRSVSHSGKGVASQQGSLRQESGVKPRCSQVNR
ncbi:hypothetical protein GOBAR_DD17355 [Gossypium barbadense]|nr:hypothetical protein GOBAR_DD17355 [Gossypium barbadense]